MTAIYERLGNKPDIIDDVRRRFEEDFTEDYFAPNNGDWIADDYERVIALSTQPGRLSSDESDKLERSIGRLNKSLDYIKRILGASSLGQVPLINAYNDVAEQVNTIFSAKQDNNTPYIELIDLPL